MFFELEGLNRFMSVEWTVLKAAVGMPRQNKLATSGQKLGRQGC